jgi:hypothetical protein
MKKLILSISLLTISRLVYSQSSITIEPNPSSSGTLTDLKINSSGKIVATNDPSKSHYYNASNLDFFPISTITSRWNAFVREGDAVRIAYFQSSQNESSFMVATVNLPNGAIITRLRASYYDNSTEKLFIQLIRRHKTTNTIPNEDIMAEVQSTDGSLVHISSSNTIQNEEINNLNYYYFIKVSIGDFTGDATQQWQGAALGIRNVELLYNY